MDEPIVAPEQGTETTETTETTVPEDSILATICHMIGPSDDYSYFYKDLIIHVNAAFSRLCQLGVGPSEPFHITDTSETWTEFVTDPARMEDVKQFVFLSVRHDFDPPANSFLMDALEKKIEKLEWLLNSVAEVGY